MNIFFNPDENRLRAGWRIAAQFFLMFFIGFGLIWLISRFIEIEGQIIPTAAIAIGAIISIHLAARGMDKRSWSDFGVMFNRQFANECGLGFLIAGGVMALIFIIEWMFGWITVTGFGWQQFNTDPYFLLFVGYFFWMIIVGIYEELVFRGYQIVNLGEGFHLNGVSRSQAVIGAVVLSSAIFGIMHATNPNAGVISTINVALAGGMLAFPFIVTGRISFSIGLHIGWNFCQGGIFGFAVSGVPGRASVLQIQQGGPLWVTGGSFGPEAGLIGLFGLALIIMGLWRYFNKKGIKIAIHPKFGNYTPSARHYPA